MSYSDIILGESGLLGYWRLGESSGATATDSSSNGKNGTYGGTITYGVTGALINDANTAIHLSGTGNVTVSGLSPFTNGTQISVEGWSYRDDTTTNDCFFGSSGGSNALLRANSGAQTVTFIANSAGGSTTWTGTPCPTASWFYWVCTFDESTDALNLFINAVSQGAKTDTHQYAASPGTFKIGARAASTDPWLGNMDEVAVYNTILSQTQISAHYVAGVNAFIARATILTQNSLNRASSF